MSRADRFIQPIADAAIWVLFYRLDRRLRRIRNDAHTP